MSTQTVSTAEDNLVHDEHATSDTQKPTPLPKFQIFIVLLIQFAERITALVIYPFVNQFVGETGITNGDELKTGYYAGNDKKSSSGIMLYCKIVGFYPG
jgi:hypothetical protein